MSSDIKERESERESERKKKTEIGIEIINIFMKNYQNEQKE